MSFKQTACVLCAARRRHDVFSDIITAFSRRRPVTNPWPEVVGEGRNRFANHPLPIAASTFTTRRPRGPAWWFFTSAAP
eukprot:5801644-Pyramimonas_sp.AAC.1